MSKKSYRSTRRPPIVNKVQTFTKGWYRDLSEKVGQLNNEIDGLEERIKAVENNRYTEFQDMKAIPHSYKRDFVFEPEEAIVDLDAYHLLLSSTYGNFIGDPPGFVPGVVEPFNYILRSGQKKYIDLQMLGDGVFVATQMQVTIYHRLFVPEQGVMNVPVSQVNATVESSGISESRVGASRASIASASYKNFTVSNINRVQYFWNLIDRSSGRRFSDFQLPSTSLLNASENTFDPSMDGEMFTFDVPWVFERDSQLDFEFQPIIDYLQVDPSSAVLPYGFDDREGNGTIRNNAVTVRVELHGAKYLTMQDAMKHGAHFWQRDDSMAKGPGGTIIDKNNFPR